ncbi:glucose 1-dehydrogenase [Aliidongia dinghuensis]|uniref:Glucose 1-dehydrogenase n=1 Tax=Aliidongia dinghuensis TaxID=1867774 RepID=A0A8J2YVV5_9PROT|nr:SDR family NAD(P)-dependent oxidoreductase [Aliidongia dinghuensis]GGF29341.1 glucose 1-dehydrogenase [Aliidongia dinghuensis]
MSDAKPLKAVVVGVGAEAGLGAALCRRFAAGGYEVLVAGTTPAKIERVAETIRNSGGQAIAVPTDTTREADVVALFDRAMADDATGPADLVVYNAGNNRPHDFRTMSIEWFEETWRVGCLGGFLVGREAARRLAPLGRGTILFTGASASLRGRPSFAAFSAAKAGLRMVAQAMAREFGPMGLHVAHVVIDGGIDGERLNSRVPQRRAEKGPDGMLQLDPIADAYWQLHRQHRSAWSHEVDLRPFVEPF